MNAPTNTSRENASAYAAEMTAEWNRVTGQRLPYLLIHDCMWQEWKNTGLTKDDIGAIVRLHRGRRTRGDNARSEVFRVLIGQPVATLEDLAAARAMQRGCTTPADEARDSVLRSAGRPTERGNDAPRSAAEIMGERPDWSKLRAAVDGAPTSPSALRTNSRKDAETQRTDTQSRRDGGAPFA